VSSIANCAAGTALGSGVGVGGAVRTIVGAGGAGVTGGVVAQAVEAIMTRIASNTPKPGRLRRISFDSTFCFIANSFFPILASFASQRLFG
jgi:hypothetical protein